MNVEDTKIYRKWNIFQYCNKLRNKERDQDCWFQAGAQDAGQDDLASAGATGLSWHQP